MMKVANVYIEYPNMALDQSYHYLCNDFDISKGKRVKVEFANKKIIGFVVDVIDMDIAEIQKLGYSIKPILEVLDKESFLNEELFQLAYGMNKAYVAPLISCFQAMLPAKLKPKSNRHAIKKDIWVVFDMFKVLKTSKQQDALLYMEENKEIKRADFNKLFATQLNALLRYNVVHLEEREAIAEDHSIFEDQRVTLTEDQLNAIHRIQSDKEHFVFLLHGVTGSGKSEVFLQLAQEVIKEDKQVLILVPEISLTPQMIARVKARFHYDVAIYHSSLNNQEKYEQYKLVHEKKVKIVVGTRSAIFMPFDNLGLIILDEEHDPSYKQESTPKYHTREIAIYRANYHQCKVVLASATPSLESYARACKNVYKLVELPSRIYGEMPQIKIVDMQKVMRNGEHYILSNELKEAIQERLNKKEQVILLLNRRGYAPVLRCMDCGDVVMCPHCDLALNYHKNLNELRCHTCGYSEKKSYCCKKCGSQHIKYIGLGTQRLEEYIKDCFPNVTIIRMDADTTSYKDAHQKLLAQFEKKGDILLGTQMIAKGLDFENVTLVGILNGDALLNRSDYRSVEFTFDLLVQASGRSGRGLKEGMVMIQVYNPDHYAIVCSQTHDYKQFFQQEMQFRHLGGYPPYTYLGVITLLHKEEAIILTEMKQLESLFEIEGIKKLGPISLIKVKDLNRMRIILKGKKQELIADLLYNAYGKHKQSKGKSKVEIDMNPYRLD